jgi:hypothetical protein
MADDKLPSFDETEELPSFDQTEELPAFDQTEDLSSSAAGELKSLAGGIVGATAGTALGAGIQSKAAAGLNKVAESLGPYSPEQLATINESYDKFQTLVPEQTMAQVEDKFRSVNRIANEAEKQAYANLTEPLTRAEYQQTVIKAAQPFTKPVPTDTPEFAQTIEELLPKRQPIDPLLEQRQSQLAQFAELKAKEKAAALQSANLGTLSPDQLGQEVQAVKAQTLANPEGFAFVPNQEAADLRNAAENARQSMDIRNAEKGAIKKLQTPLAKEFPELSGKMISSTAPVNERDIRALLNEYKFGDKLSGDEAYQLVRQIRESAFKPNSEVRSEAAKAVQKELRDLVGSKNPEASAELQRMSKQIEELKGLEKAGYLKRDKSVSKNSGEFVQLGEKQAKQLAKDVTPNLFGAGATMTDDAAERLVTLKKTLSPELYKDLELSLLKEVALDPKRQLKIGAIDTVMAALSPASSAIGIGTKAVKTPKGAIAASRLADNLAQFKGLAGKALPGVLGAVGGLAGATMAAQAGEITPGEAAVLAPIEALNPTPLDAVGAYAAGKKEYQESGSIPATALAGAQGAVQPMIDLARITPQVVEELGTQKSISARERMEQNMEAFKALKKPFKPTAPSHSVEDIQATHDWFKASTDPVAQTYAGALEKAANSQDERTRAAVMFGLEQQPAFRELQRKQKLGQ